MTRKAAVSLVTSPLFPLILLTRIDPDETPNSGNEIVMLGFDSATAERTNNVTFTSQSADWSGGSEGLWPTLCISIDFSSMKIEGEKLIGDVGEDALGAD